MVKYRSDDKYRRKWRNNNNTKENNMITEKQSRLLVCAAEDEVCREMISLLGRIGFPSVELARSAEEAERLLSESTYDLFICDASVGSVQMMQLAYNEKRRAESGVYHNTELLLVGEKEYADILREVCRMLGALSLIKPYTISAFCDAVLGALSNVSARTKKSTAPTSANTRPSTHSISDTPTESQITEILHTLGIPAHIKGFAYLRCAIGMTIADPDMINYVTKSLYPSVAKQFGTATSRVERAIRHAIEVAWDRGDVETLNRYFGYTISRQRGKPTNSEFIAMISDKLRLGVGV